LQVKFTRFGEENTTEMVLTPSSDYVFSLMEDKDEKPSKQVLEHRKAWLKVE